MTTANNTTFKGDGGPEQNTASDPERAKKIIMQAERAFKGGELELATGLYKRVIEVAPTEAFTYWAYGYHLYETDDFEAAVELIETASKMEPANAKYVSYHGRCLFEIASDRINEKLPEDGYDYDAFEAAMLLLYKAHDMEPDNIEFLIDLIECYQTMGALDEAFECCQTILELDDTHAMANKFIADCYMYKEQEEKAVPYMETAVFHDPDNSYFRARLAKAYTLCGRFDAAENELFEGINRDPTDPELSMQLSSLYTMQERFDDALTQLRKARRKAENSHEYQYLIKDIDDMEQAINEDIGDEYDDEDDDLDPRFDLGISTEFDLGHNYKDSEQGHDDENEPPGMS